jgi:hypothetical protein
MSQMFVSGDCAGCRLIAFAEKAKEWNWDFTFDEMADQLRGDDTWNREAATACVVVKSKL